MIKTRKNNQCATLIIFKMQEMGFTINEIHDACLLIDEIITNIGLSVKT